MEHIKEAFNKVKQDIELLKKEVSNLNRGLIETRQSLIEVCEVLKVISKKTEEINENKKESPKEDIPAHTSQNKTDPIKNPTHPAHNLPQNVSNTQNMVISTGNRGVPADRQTNQQTDQHIIKGSYNEEIHSKNDLNPNPITNATQILESLDNLKKEIRLKFKRLTEQEFLVFSTIYQLSEETGYTDYKNLSEKLHLTESSIRDYIGRLIKKGVPLDKIKINNKTIHISVSPSFKKIATLPTILQLRSI